MLGRYRLDLKLPKDRGDVPFSTVASDTKRVSAIPRFDFPSAISLRTSQSRGLSSPHDPRGRFRVDTVFLRRLYILL